MIKNGEELIALGTSENDRRAMGHVLELLEVGLAAADPRKAIERNVSIKGSILRVVGEEYDLSIYKHVYVIGAGKASGAMAESLDSMLGGRISSGLVNVLKDTKGMFKTKRIRLNEATHPIPDENGVNGAREMLGMMQRVGAEDLVIVLISGGASALMPLPVKGLSLEEKKETTRLLLGSGKSIDEVNVVRKHISAIKGGQLARAIYPATGIALIISDVVGDDLSTIGSGPTVPDQSTYQDALRILKDSEILELVPKVKKHLESGIQGKVHETPKSEDNSFLSMRNFIISSNCVVLDEMVKKSRELGVNVKVLDYNMTGEAREVGVALAETVSKAQNIVLLQGGETTVTVRGDGKGGRNQEMVLSALIKMSEQDGVAIASIGTDGIDGMSDAAGAIIDGHSSLKAIDMGLDLKDYLERNDSDGFFRRLGGRILTGPTGTNVNDIVVAVVL